RRSALHTIAEAQVHCLVCNTIPLIAALMQFEYQEFPCFLVGFIMNWSHVDVIDQSYKRFFFPSNLAHVVGITSKKCAT
ncbi:hypothetical protein ACJX0J_016858, partial [Zea mays]